MNTKHAKNLDLVAECIHGLVTALTTIMAARDYHAEQGQYPEGTLQPDQCFDDWAADVSDKALRQYEMTLGEV